MLPIPIQVKCRESASGAEHPVCFICADAVMAVDAVVENWQSNDARYFKAEAGGRLCLLKHDTASDTWWLENQW